ncbi:hypothetical protein SEA_SCOOBYDOOBYDOO_18 [Mycobacterium phage ScoobyDoobyDoo]|nr:hypothetical protein SEA_SCOOBYDOOBYDOO_18 [Mycobacterium phage ScoobyDoobyDoo]
MSGQPCLGCGDSDWGGWYCEECDPLAFHPPKEENTMDPNETLKMIRAALEEGDDERAAEHFRDLDGWLSKGGFLPTDWVRP